MTARERGLWNSGARVDATTLTLMVESAPLRAHLATLGVLLQPVAAAPPGMQPVIVDLWHVEAARMEVAGLDQHLWSGVLGGWFGAAAGFLAGGVSGSLKGLVDGVARGASEGARFGEDMSDRMSRTFGTYQEVLVAVPNVNVPGHDGGPYLFVLGMLSNGAVSIWGDRMLRCGYRKAPSAIARRGFDRFEVRDGERTEPTASLEVRERSTWGPVDPRLGEYAATLSHPLLGRLDDGSFAVTYLDRFLDAAGVRWAPVSGQLNVAERFMDGLQPGAYPLHGVADDRPWGAFHVEGLPVKVTFPRTIRTQVHP